MNVVRKMDENKSIYLTKSRYVRGLECSKRIWLEFNRPEDLPIVDEALQHRFDEGNEVGELAKQLFPNGIDIQERIPAQNDKKSRELLKKRKPLFEAGFLHKNGKCYARADILLPVGKSQWDLIEVKSATSVKEYYLEDISFQKYCYESAGLKIRNCFVLHINNEYVRKGKIDPKELFVQRDVTETIKPMMAQVPSKIKKLFKIIKLKKCPEFKAGEEYHKDDEGIHDNDKFWKDHPDSDILDLYYGGKNAIELFNAGILRIKDHPAPSELNEKQKIQHKVHSTGVHHVNHDELTSFMGKLAYPLYFVDFESYNTAIPLYQGLKPYQQLPFQFALFIIEKKGQKPKYHSFIAKGAKDPRAQFIKELKKVLGTKGSIVVYNRSFEKGVLESLAVYLPKYAKWVKSTTERMVDLLVPFRNFHYYHHLQKGSASLKYVLPALTGITYDDFEIANGSQASLSYLFITHGSSEGKKASSKEILKVRTDLEKYCRQDTEGMVKILNKMEWLIK